MDNEITIKMINPNKPPEIKLNGKKIKDIISIGYVYETSNDDNNGKHLYNVIYFDKESNSIRTLMVSKIT